MTKAVATNNVSDVNYHENSLEIFSLIWLGINVDMKDDLDIQRKLRTIINHQKKFQYGEECRRYIETSSVQASIVLIVNDQLGIEFIPSIHELRQVSSIHVLCKTKSSEEWTRDFPKVKSVVTDLNEVFCNMRLDHQIQRKTEPLIISTFSTFDDAGKSTTGINGRFIFSQLLIDCILRINSNEMDKTELISYCKNEYENNKSELSNILEFQEHYFSNKAIWWYSRETFFYKTLNASLRKQDIHIMFLYRSFISDIYGLLQNHQSKVPVKVYRSQLMSLAELEDLKQHIGSFISINSFLSTTKERQVAIFYMGDRVNLTDSVQVLFEIEADPKVVTTKPFADISTISYFPSESEVLFMLGSIFCLDNIICDDDQMWVIHMTLSSDEEHALREVLTDMKNSNENGETCLRSLGKLLWNMGMLDLADKYYRRFVNEISLNDPLRMTLFEELGNIASQKACKSIIAETLPPEHRNSALEKQIAECQDQPELDLGWSHLTDQDMSIVAYYCLYNNKTLLKLNLSSNKIGERGAHYLADALYSNNTLTVLNLENNQIGDKGARSLADAIKHNNTLKELRLLDYTISFNVKKQFKIQDGRIWC
ncbi:unnamed protein product [Rotaria socialis]|uniref:Uncharacterized protein n=2 Tax=Rotaria socialis TaxID=392032 RepID=A0A817PDX3_9BILA|nr:unnamed protein product [Rotaria socialis]